jgi:hypothetical protein
MALLELQNTTPLPEQYTPQIDASSGSTRRSLSPQQVNATFSVRKRRVFHTNKPIPYVRGLSKRERVDMVLHELFEKHRWSIKDLIYHLVTAKPEKRYGMKCSARAKTLSDAIYKQEEVVNRLSRASKDIQKVGNTELTNRLRAELQAVSKPNIGLGKFESEKEVDELDIPALTERVQKAAPEPWTLLASLMEPPRATSNRDAGTLKGSTVMICSILAYGRTPRKCNNLPMLLGLHLHSMGVKRRTINVLAGLGVTSSYRAINIKQEKLADIGKVLPSLFKFMCPTNPVEDKG